MGLTRQEWELFGLIVDGGAPVSIVYPELREIYDGWHGLSAADLDRLLRSLESRRLIVVSSDDPDSAVDELRAIVVREYASGVRSSDVVRQILDRPDLWIETTNEGRAEYFAAPHRDD